MRISIKDLNMLLVLLSLIIIMIVYFFLYNPALAETDALKLETQSLKPQLSELNASKSREAELQNEINAIQESLDAEIKRYPVSMPPESIIMYITGIEEKYSLNLPTVSFSEPWSVREFNTFVNGEPKPMTFYSVDFSMQGSFSYSSLKDFLRGISTDDSYTSLTQVSMSYDASSGMLTGSMGMKKYFMSDGTEPYSAVIVPGINYGMDDLFVSIAPPEPEPPAEAAENQ